ncbi:hypothetical protein [Methanoregula sp.]|jgi:hypothetical protein
MTLDEKAEKAIDEVFSDHSVTEDETLNRLQSLREHIEILMNSIE